MSNLSYQLSQTRIDDLLREAADLRRARQGSEHYEMPSTAIARAQRRRARGLRVLRRMLRPSAPGKAAAV